MQKQKLAHKRRVKSLVVIFSLTAIVLSVSTYAWFIGMRTVNVSSFDVEIAATESLALSLDGKSWGDTVNISKENFDKVYEGNTNWWAGKGLIPMSTIGAMDSSVSRMILYEKAGISATTGGYRLIASRVENYEEGKGEQDGYVAFDLYVKNFSGTQYLEAKDENGEEAIYLTVDSAVSVATSGVANTGIENSVRVAFAQIGRVKADTTNQTVITGITCNDDNVNKVTGLCRTAQIWEPNDKKHVASAIEWYNTACLTRTGENVNDAISYGTRGEEESKCKPLVNNTSYPTYAIREAIVSGDNVNIYDGVAYNGYTNSTQLHEYEYFTDTKKELTGVDRPEFMYLAPNSITKVRIYIYIEGQDIDNYDFASIGKAISVKFGFTKERFEEADTNYDGPELKQAPEVTLNGDTLMIIKKGVTYSEPGAVATDKQDTEAPEVIITGEVLDEVGEYIVTYSATDQDGNKTVKTRTVKVIE